MNRRTFARSWGRKLFFGYSWPLSLGVGLIYLRSFILPETTLDYFYFVPTFIAHFGLLNLLVYFLLYCPVSFVFPTYYFSRLWGIFLIVFLNGLILLDALCFSTFKTHLYSFLAPLQMDEIISQVIEAKILTSAMTVVLLSLWVFLWGKGNRIWTFMQRRFSNPVSNWYLLLIISLFLGGNTLFYLKPVTPQLAGILPLNVVMNVGIRR